MNSLLSAGVYTFEKEKNEVVTCRNSDIDHHSYLVSLLFAAPIPTLVIYMKFFPLVYTYTHVCVCKL